MKISVITVVFNAGDTIEDTILSVHRQTHADREHIIIDGNSTDNTKSIIERHRDKISIYLSEPDKGLYDAMNKGIRLATGDVTGFLNADDVYANDNVLSTINREFEKGRIDGCYGDLIYVSRYSQEKIIRYWRSKMYTPGLCRRGWMPPHPTFYLKSEVLRACGGFNLAYRFQSDYELCLRLFEIEKIRTSYIPQVLVKMRMGGVSNNSLRNIFAGNMEAYKACKTYFPKTTPFFIPGKILSRLNQFFRKYDDHGS